MKQFSVSELKRGRFSPQTRMEPRPGSKRRVLWDKLFATPGAPVELTPDEFGGDAPAVALVQPRHQTHQER